MREVTRREIYNAGAFGSLDGNEGVCVAEVPPVEAHVGHVGDGGIQGHSAGRHFPWVIVQTGDNLIYARHPDGRVTTPASFDNGDPNSHWAAHERTYGRIEESDFQLVNRQTASRILGYGSKEAGRVWPAE